jgi:hypothetical protein
MTHTKLFTCCAALIAGLTGACSSSTPATPTGASGTGAAGTGAAGMGAAGTGAAGTGAGGPVMLATAPGCTSINLAVAGGTLYFTDKAKGTVSSVPTAGGATAVVAMSQMAPGPIAADATAVIWANDGDKSIMKKPLPSGAAAAFMLTGTAEITKANMEVVNTLLIDNGTLYVGRGRYAIKAPVAGGTATQLLYSPDGDEGLPGAFALSATHIYNTQLHHQSISRAKLDGTQMGMTEDGMTLMYAPDRMAVSQGSLVLDAIAFAMDHAIWANGSNIVAHLGSAGEKVSHINVASSAAYSPITGFVLTNNTIYLGEGSGENNVEKVALAIPTDPNAMVPEAKVVASGQKDPSQFVADATNIYWRTSDCNIMKMAK